MVKIHSKIDDRVLHIIQRLDEIKEPRVDVIEEENFLQLAVLKMEKGKTFRPHIHKFKPVKYTEAIAQESWVVLKGRVRCYYYDLDASLLGAIDLYQGDASITLYGGHNFQILEEDTIVYEFKTGPYEGVEMDKEFLD